MSGSNPGPRRTRREARAEPAEPRPADECPYARPFPDDFHDCPAYAARRFVPFDSLHRPLQPVWTCNFLAPRRSGAAERGYYAACALGDGASRQRWVEEVRTERLARVVALQSATTSIANPYLTEIYAAKGRQLASKEDSLEASATLNRLLAQLEAEVNAYIDAHRIEFEAASLPVDACKQIMTLALRSAAESRTLGSTHFRPPDALLEMFPVEVRPLLFPATNPD
ncbi:MAG TPA: hypothetical protein VGR61_02505 [Candidatus Dormibacteraeota bacterium]|nr:hypothetical protein [Candidatus Dormibacteraeota bacterium]